MYLHNKAQWETLGENQTKMVIPLLSCGSPSRNVANHYGTSIYLGKIAKSHCSLPQITNKIIIKNDRSQIAYVQASGSSLVIEVSDTGWQLIAIFACAVFQSSQILPDIWMVVNCYLCICCFPIITNFTRHLE